MGTVWEWFWLIMFNVLGTSAVVGRMIAITIATGDLVCFWFFTFFGGMIFAPFYTAWSEVAVGRRLEDWILELFSWDCVSFTMIVVVCLVF